MSVPDLRREHLRRVHVYLRRVPMVAAAETGMSERPICVTQPAPPPLEEFAPYMETIWANRFLTNGGSLHQRFEQAPAEYLGVEHLSLFTSGTTALVTVLQALHIAGEVINTPYSFVPTAHSRTPARYRPSLPRDVG